MDQKKKRTSPLLVILSLLICIGSAAAVTYTSSEPSPADSNSFTDLLSLVMPKERTLASAVTDSGTAEKAASADGTAASEAAATGEDEVIIPEENFQSVLPSIDLPEEDPSYQRPVSEFADRGTWTKTKGRWYFMVDGAAITGWLYDSDGKTYYFDHETNYMLKDWQEIDGVRYFFDKDGILQTFKATYNDQIYYFHPDGTINEERTSKEALQAVDDIFAQKAAEAASAEAENSADASEVLTEEEIAKAAAGSSGLVALTFDDGPGSFTGRLLDCREKYNVKATFFMVGREIESFPEEVARMEKLGCELGNHSYDHTDLTTLNADQIRKQIEKTDSLISSAAGHPATLIRPPYGNINKTVRKTLGVPMILWSIDTLDWESQDPKQIVPLALSEVTDGSIILMHDIFSTSVDAVEKLIPKLIKKGYKLVTVSELAAARGVTLEAGTAYGSFYPE